MQSAAVAAAGAVHPVTSQTLRIIEEMRATLTCPACHKLLRDPFSLPCQHHHCRDCIEGYLELHSVCPQCKCKFWAKDLVANHTINAMLKHFESMKYWLDHKKDAMEGTAGAGAGAGGGGGGAGRGGGGGGGGGAGGEGERKGRRGDDKRHEGDEKGDRSAGRGHTAPQDKRAHNPAAQSPARRTPRRHADSPVTGRSSVSPQHAAAASSSFAASAAAAAAAAASHTTPPRVSLKDTIAAASSTSSAAAKSAPRSSLSALPRPAGASALLHTPTVAAAPVGRFSPIPSSGGGGGGGSHSKQFSKQGFTKTGASPVPTSTAAHTPLVGARSSAASPSFGSPIPAAATATASAKARKDTIVQLFGEQDGPPSSLGDSDSDIMEVDPAQLRSAVKATKRPQLYANTPSPSPQPASLAAAAASVGPFANGPRQPMPLAQPAAKSSLDAGVKTSPSTLDGFLIRDSQPLSPAAVFSPAPTQPPGVVKTALTSKVLADAAGAPAAPSAAAPSAHHLVDADGDAMMLAADVTRLVQDLRHQDIPTQFQNLSALSQPGLDLHPFVPPTAIAVPAPTPAATASALSARPAPIDGAATTSPRPASRSSDESSKSPHIPPSAVSSLSPKLSSAPNSGGGGGAISSGSGGGVRAHAGPGAISRDRSAPLLSGSIPPALPHTGSLSMPGSYLSQQAAAAKDSFSSPPPLEPAPLINIYSPAPSLPPAAEDEIGNDSAGQQRVPPARRSLIETVAALNASVAVAVAVPPASPPPSTPPSANAAAAASPSAVVAPTSPTVLGGAVSAAPSAAPSDFDGISAHLSPMTEGSIAGRPVVMPSMAMAAAQRGGRVESAPHTPTQRTAVVSQHASPVTAPGTPSAARAILPAEAVSDAVAPVAAISTATTAVAAPVCAPVPAPPAAPVAEAGAAVISNGAVDGAAAGLLQAATLSINPADSPSTATSASSPEFPPNLSLVQDRPMVISFTSLTPAQTTELKAFCARTNTTLLHGKRWTTGVTHVICAAARRTAGDASGSSSGSQALASRSLKYMQGVLVGCWIVEWGWAAASMARGNWTAETPFEIAGDVTRNGALTLSPRRSRLREEALQPRLLRGVKISVDPRMVKNVDPAQAELNFLVQLGQGVLIPTPAVLLPPSAEATATGAAPGAPGTTVSPPATALLSSGVSRLPAAAATPGSIYLLCRGNAAAVYDPRDMARLGSQTGMIPVSVQWLLDSISEAKLLDADMYRCDFTQEEKAAIKQRKDAAAAATAAQAAAALVLPDDANALMSRLAS